MTPDLLAEVGTALYGDQWQSAFARALGVADRTVRRWAAGDSQIPDGVLADARKLLSERMKELRAVSARL